MDRRNIAARLDRIVDLMLPGSDGSTVSVNFLMHLSMMAEAARAFARGDTAEAGDLAEAAARYRGALPRVVVSQELG
ncbi:MAG: hypothetical protein ACRDRL_29640 [Sciscionella sp.]